MRIRPHVLKSEAECDCGCGAMPYDKWLDVVEKFIVECNFSIPISSMARCKAYTAKIGSKETSAHRFYKDTDIHWVTNGNSFGAADLKCRDSGRRMIVVTTAINLMNQGLINNIEVCDRHIHIAYVPKGHKHYMKMYWGRSV